MLSVLCEEVFDQLAIMFVLDAGEETCAEFLDGRGFVERQLVIHLATAEVARHALRLKDWFELSVKIDSRFYCGRSWWICGRGIRRSRRLDDAARLDEQQHQRNHDKHEPHVAIIRLPQRLPNVLGARSLLIWCLLSLIAVFADGYVP